MAAAKKTGLDAVPWATIVTCALAVIYAVTGAAVVVFGDPGALSFQEYGSHLLGFAAAVGLVGIGRGIAARK